LREVNFVWNYMDIIGNKPLTDLNLKYFCKRLSRGKKHLSLLSGKKRSAYMAHGLFFPEKTELR